MSRTGTVVAATRVAAAAGTAGEATLVATAGGVAATAGTMAAAGAALTLTRYRSPCTALSSSRSITDTTGDGFFAECPTLCRVLFIGHSAKRLFTEGQR